MDRRNFLKLGAISLAAPACARPKKQTDNRLFGNAKARGSRLGAPYFPGDIILWQGMSFGILDDRVVYNEEGLNPYLEQSDGSAKSGWWMPPDSAKPLYLCHYRDHLLCLTERGAWELSLDDTLQCPFVAKWNDDFVVSPCDTTRGC